MPTPAATPRTVSSNQRLHRAGTSRHLQAEYIAKATRRSPYVYVVPAVSRQIWRDEFEIGAVRDVFPMGSERVLLDVETSGGWVGTNALGMRVALGGGFIGEQNPILAETALVPLLTYLGLEPRSTPTTSLAHFATLSLEVARSKVLLRDLDRLHEIEGANMRALASPSGTQVSPVIVEPARLPVWTMSTLAVGPLLIAAVLMAVFAGWLPAFVGVAVTTMLLTLVVTAALQFKAIYRASHRVVGAERAYVRATSST